jgi:hypothetical protein
MEIDEESGRDGGTEVANQIKSSCNLNVNGGKKQLGKEGATKGSCEKDISAETEDSKGNVDGLDEPGDGDNVVGENCEKSSANENNNNNGGNSDEIDQSSDSNKGSDMEVSSDEGQTDDESTKEKGAKDDGDDEESGKDGGTEGADQIKSSCNLNVMAVKTIRERRCN